MIVELRCPEPCNRLLRRYQRTEDSSSEDAWASHLIGDAVGDVVHCQCGRSERLSKADAVVGSQRGPLTALRGLRQRAHAAKEVPPPLPRAKPAPKRVHEIRLVNGLYVEIDGKRYDGDAVSQDAEGRIVVGRRAPAVPPSDPKAKN